jgi:hypothetical protein
MVEGREQAGSAPHARLDDWLQHLPPSGVRASCRWERFCTFAREPERRKVGIDARVSAAGGHDEVDTDLAGETVVLWRGLFDNELDVEHGERRFGPYAPIGGPIPLHRYRAFKNTPTPRRAERIEALAVQLALPRVALEGHPHAGAFEQATDVPAIPFADPYPFQEFAYPTVLMAKRAIADEQGRPQGGVVSPRLATRFWPDTVAVWKPRRHPDSPCERAADEAGGHVSPGGASADDDDGLRHGC